MVFYRALNTQIPFRTNVAAMPEFEVPVRLKIRK